MVSLHSKIYCHFCGKHIDDPNQAQLTWLEEKAKNNQDYWNHFAIVHQHCEEDYQTQQHAFLNDNFYCCLPLGYILESNHLQIMGMVSENFEAFWEKLLYVA